MVGDGDVAALTDPHLGKNIERGVDPLVLDPSLKTHQWNIFHHDSNHLRKLTGYSWPRSVSVLLLLLQ